MMTLHHTSSLPAVTPHVGLCLTPSPYANYGDNRFVAELPIWDLTTEEVEVDIDAISTGAAWPGDTEAERAELAARGIDVLVYDDMDYRGTNHRTYRLISDRAVAACRIELAEE